MFSTYATTTSSRTKSSCLRASRAISAPSSFSSGTERVPQAGISASAATASAAAVRLRRRRGMQASALAQGLRHVADDEQHGAIEGVVVDDRDAMALRRLEQVVLDAQDGVEV